METPNQSAENRETTNASNNSANLLRAAGKLDKAIQAAIKKIYARERVNISSTININNYNCHENEIQITVYGYISPADVTDAGD